MDLDLDPDPDPKHRAFLQQIVLDVVGYLARRLIIFGATIIHIFI